MPHACKAVLELVVNEPIGCHLQTIGSVGGAFAWPTGATEFDKCLQRNHGVGDGTPFGYKGRHFTGTLVSCRFDEKTDEELKKRGFRVLGIQAGAHQTIDCKYKMYLYGLGFEDPSKEQ